MSIEKSKAREILPILLLGSLLPAAECAPQPGCNREPSGELIAFLDDPENPSADFDGSLVEALPRDSLGFQRFVFREEAGTTRRLALRAPEDPPFRVGARYAVRVEHVGGVPAASGIWIKDSAGLLFAGASDDRPGSHVLREGVPGFNVDMLPSTCPLRARDRCLAVSNATLRFTHRGQTVNLHHGESAQLGTYRASSLSAQEVQYTGQCPDAVLVGSSYLISRAPP